MKRAISHRFSRVELLKFAFPSVIMMIFLSIYTIVDGIFLAKVAGTDSFAAVNITYPFTTAIFSLALMFGTGGSAVIAIMLGQKRKLEARQCFSFIVLTLIITVGIICILSYIFIDRLISLLGADTILFPLAHSYLRIIIIFTVPAALQSLFVSFFVTASRPRLGLFYTLAAGFTNVLLDFIFVVLLKLGIEGAALATGIAYCIPAVGGIIFFLKHNRGLCFARPRLRLDILRNCCSNGLSEMMNNLSACIVTLIFNLTMLKYIGSSGIAAIAVILYCEFLFTAVFIGYAIGITPIISYHYGAENSTYFRKLLNICLQVIIITSLLLFLITYCSASWITALFAKENSNTFKLAYDGLRIFSFSIIFSGINIFTSAALTAVARGRASTLISLSRSLILVIIGMYIFIHILQTASNAIWLSLPFSEILTGIITIYYFHKLKKHTL